MATASSRGNSNAVGKIVGPKAAKMGGGNINPRGEVNRPGDPGGHVWPKAAAKPVGGSTPLKASRPYQVPIKADGKWPTRAVKINTNPVPARTSGLQGREVGAMDHQGGHGLQGGAISVFGGGGLPEQTR
jgi:hypothetical protein